MRLFLIVLSLLFSGHGVAQERVMRGAQAQADSRPGTGSAQCRIGEVVWTNSGAGFVCDMGTDGRAFMATDGGSRPGGIAAFMSWLQEARNMPSARDYVTVNYEAPDAASQAICDATGLRGQSNRTSITCYRILAVID